MRIPPLRCPALRVGRFSALNKAVPVKNIPFAKEPSAQKRNNTRSFLPGPIKKGKNADCFAVPFKVISRVPRQKRVKIDRQNFPKSFPEKRFTRARAARRSTPRGRGATVFRLTREDLSLWFARGTPNGDRSNPAARVQHLEAADIPRGRSEGGCRGRVEPSRPGHVVS